MPVIPEGTLACSICGHTRSSITHSLLHSNRTFMSVAAEQNRRRSLGRAGEREMRKRQNGSLVSVADGNDAGLDTAGGRWQSICETHGSVIAHETRRLASFHAVTPWEWCEECPEPEGEHPSGCRT